MRPLIFIFFNLDYCVEAVATMSEYWVSRKKWTCKYCNVTINDDVPSRQHHENGLRHKGNVERSLKEAYRKSERERKDEREAKREMERIERLAQDSMARDAPASAAPATSASPPAESSSKQAQAPTQQKWKPKGLSAYGSAVAHDLSSKELEAEQRLLEQEEEKRKQGTAGQWQTVAVEPSATAGSSTGSATASHGEDEGDRERARRFKVNEKKAYLDDDGSEEDEPAIKVKKRPRVEQFASSSSSSRQEEEARKMVPATWTPLQLQRSKDIKKEGLEAVPVPPPPEVKAEDGDVVPVVNLVDEVKKEEKVEFAEERKEDDATAKVGAGTEAEAGAAAASGGSSSGEGMFKKRKAGAGAGAKKVRAFV